MSKESLYTKFLNQFKKTPIDPNEELEFDICMKCGARLVDKKRSTWKKHQDEIHPEKRKQIIIKYLTKYVVGLAIGFVFLIIVIVVTLSPGSTLPQDCSERTTILENKWKESGVSTEDISELEYLTTNCGINMYVRSGYITGSGGD